MVLSQSLGYLWNKHTRDDFAAMLNVLYVRWSGIDQSDIFRQWYQDRAQKPPDMRTSALVSVPCIPAIRFSKWRRSIFKFVKDQWNVSQDSLIHACSLSASWFAKKCTSLGIIILIFFACALRHCRVMTGYVTLKYQAKLRTIAWKVFATLKCPDSTWLGTSGTYSIEKIIFRRNHHSWMPLRQTVLLKYISLDVLLSF